MSLAAAAAAAAAVAGASGRPAATVGAGIGLAVAGYVVSAPFPLREGWKHAQYIAPWNRALGGSPLTDPAEWWRCTAPLGLAALLMGCALLAFGRRDVHAP
ncbi:hypothetical protein [Streptomyces sp. VRA16 Mangrove soil]|uniref:hypothetical protein n=1 Tax=Streptomyces sp. VRA16 Mangrove soil TaxID=2817434 RepID=UPI001A9D8DCD|nr:hypothetical protein [Streptomyces sp. VRA16 Mangrove soil]MBO1329788.1 hypothetical protein [Streptomyces sp. VRA16 Mangrove soil]